MTDIAVDGLIRLKGPPPEFFDVRVQEIGPCECDNIPGDHPGYRIKDPRTSEPDWVCSRDVTKVNI